MFNVTAKSSKVVRVLGLFGLMVALAGMVATAPAASAATKGGYPPSSTVAGKLAVYVADGVKGESLVGASVALLNDKGEAIAKGSTNSNGYYAVYAVQGAYKVRVEATGFTPYTQAVQIVSGQVTTVKAALQPSTTVSPVATGTITVSAFDMTGASDVPLAGATVLITDAHGNIVVKGLTDDAGIFKASLSVGDYKVSVQADGYKESIVVVTVGANDANEISVGLSK